MIRIVEDHIRTKYCYNHRDTLTLQFDADAVKVRIEPSVVEPGSFFEHHYIVCPSCSGELPLSPGTYNDMMTQLMDHRAKMEQWAMVNGAT